MEPQALALLGASERESLALAIFLVEQLDGSGAHDYSAPAIHLSSVMELEVQRRVFGCPTLVGEIANPKRQTLGVLPRMRRFPEETDGNWDRVAVYVAARWQTHIVPNDNKRAITFDMFISKALDHISQLRNHAAHPYLLTRTDYTDLQKLMLRGGKLGYGALNVLLLAWHEQLDFPAPLTFPAD